MLKRIKRWFLEHCGLKEIVDEMRGRNDELYSNWKEAERIAARALRNLEESEEYYRRGCKFCGTKTVCDNCVHRTGIKGLCQACGGPGIEMKPYTNLNGDRVNICRKCWEGANSNEILKQLQPRDFNKPKLPPLAPMLDPAIEACKQLESRIDRMEQP